MVGRGWLIENDGSYKLHQIIKEFLLANYAPCFEEIEEVIKYFVLLIDDNKIKKTSYSNNYIIYFNALIEVLNRYSYINELLIFLLIGVASSYLHLGLYDKSLKFYNQADSISIDIFSSNN